MLSGFLFVEHISLFINMEVYYLVASIVPLKVIYFLEVFRFMTILLSLCVDDN